MRIVLTIEDKKYGHIPEGEIRSYIHLALGSWGGGGDPNDELFYGLEVAINVLGLGDANIIVDGKTGEILFGTEHWSDDALLALEKKIENQRGN